MIIYIAMAEFQDGNRIFEKAYRTYQEAEKAAQAMVDDVNSNTEWQVIPIVEDMEFVDE